MFRDKKSLEYSKIPDGVIFISDLMSTSRNYPQFPVITNLGLNIFFQSLYLKLVRFDKKISHDKRFFEYPKHEM